MAKISIISRSSVDKPKNGTPKKYEAAKDMAGTAYYQFQDNAKAGLQKAQGLLAVAAGILGVILQDNTRKARKELKKAQKRSVPMQQSVQENIAASLEKAQGKMQSGMTSAQKLLAKNAYMAQYNLNKAQKNLRDMQKSWQSNVVPAVTGGVATGLEKTRDVFSKGSEKAGQRFQQATSTARNVKESVQDQYTQYQRKRQRARTLFRWGLLVGVVGTILYTPIAGSDVRQRLVAQWQQCRSYLGM
jgi:hypothetical protein